MILTLIAVVVYLSYPFLCCHFIFFVKKEIFKKDLIWPVLFDCLIFFFLCLKKKKRKQKTSVNPPVDQNSKAPTIQGRVSEGTCISEEEDPCSLAPNKAGM